MVVPYERHAPECDREAEETEPVAPLVAEPLLERAEEEELEEYGYGADEGEGEANFFRDEAPAGWRVAGCEDGVEGVVGYVGEVEDSVGD